MMKEMVECFEMTVALVEPYANNVLLCLMSLDSFRDCRRRSYVKLTTLNSFIVIIRPFCDSSVRSPTSLQALQRYDVCMC